LYKIETLLLFLYLYLYYFLLLIKKSSLSLNQVDRTYPWFKNLCSF